VYHNCKKNLKKMGAGRRKPTRCPLALLKAGVARTGSESGFDRMPAWNAEWEKVNWEGRNREFTREGEVRNREEKEIGGTGLTNTQGKERKGGGCPTKKRAAGRGKR